MTDSITVTDSDDNDPPVTTEPVETGTAGDDSGLEPVGEQPDSGTIERLQEQIRKLNDENARRRIAARESEERVAAVMKALGITPDDEQDPATEAGRLREELRAARVRELAYRVAATSATHPAVVPYLIGTGALTGIPDDSDEAAERVQAAIDVAVKTVPVFAGTAPNTNRQPPSNGPAPTGGAAPPQQFTRAQIQAMTPQELERNLDAIEAWERAGSPGIDG